MGEPAVLHMSNKRKQGKRKQAKCGEGRWRPPACVRHAVPCFPAGCGAGGLEVARGPGPGGRTQREELGRRGPAAAAAAAEVVAPALPPTPADCRLRQRPMRCGCAGRQA